MEHTQQGCVLGACIFGHFWDVSGRKCGGSANLPGLTRIPNKQTEPPGCSRLDGSLGSWFLSAIPMAVRKPLFLAAADRRNAAPGTPFASRGAFDEPRIRRNC